MARFDKLDPPGVLGLLLEPDVRVTTPPGEPLHVPNEAEHGRPDERAGSAISIGELNAGALALSSRYVFHVCTALQAVIPAVEVAGGDEPQRQVGFALSDWRLTLVQARLGSEAERGLAYVVGAIYVGNGSATAAVLDELRWRLFMLLSFIAGREVGIGPTCGLDEAGELVWIHWAPPRLRAGRPGARWCTRDLVASALPVLATGFTQLSTNSAALAVVDRAINHLLMANGDEALDVRVPVACSALELLGWSVLQRDGWISSDVINQRALSAAARTRLLLAWAALEPEVPANLTHLAARAGASGQDWGGPEILFEVRNKLVHPPKKLDDPEWPSTDELLESWQLSTWYLELAILRVLGYDGKYWSRLRLGREGADTEPVPWS